MAWGGRQAECFATSRRRTSFALTYANDKELLERVSGLIDDVDIEYHHIQAVRCAFDPGARQAISFQVRYSVPDAIKEAFRFIREEVRLFCYALP